MAQHAVAAVTMMLIAIFARVDMTVVLLSDHFQKLFLIDDVDA